MNYLSDEEFDDFISLCLGDVNDPLIAAAGAGAFAPAAFDFDAELAEARANPEAWIAKRGGLIKRIARRPGFKVLLRRHPEARRSLEPGDCDALIEFGTEGRYGMSEENKLKWHKRIQRALPVLKIIAGAIPPPYNFAVMGLSILLILIDERRLKPVELMTFLAAAA